MSRYLPMISCFAVSVAMILIATYFTSLASR